MRGKIMMMVLLCALLVGLVPPSNARAEDIDENYEGVVAYIKELGKIGYTFPSDRHYVVYEDVSGTILFISVAESLPYYRLWNNEDKLSLQYGHNLAGYSLADGVWTKSSTLDCYSHKSEHRIGFARIIASSCDIIDYDTGAVFFECNPPYSFSKWCSDAGLNCTFVDLDGSDVNFSYTDMLVVRQGEHVVGGNGYYLTHVNISDNSAIFPTLVDWHVGLATMSDEWLGYYVKQYMYDYFDMRWEMCEDVVTQEVRAGSPIPSIGCALSDSVGLVFSNRDLFASDYSVAFSKSDSFMNEPYYAPSVPEEPEVTPSPSVPAPSLGYDVFVYKPSLVAEVALNNVKLYELPSCESAPLAIFLSGWSLSVQGYCQDKDGVIWYLCSAVRDDITYTGYMQAKQVKVESYNGIDVNIGDVSLDDIPSVIETAKDSVISALELVSVVPLMMGAVFGFLPSWCLLMVGVAFVFICVVGLIKVFRG